jgi:hypothetical protein
MFRTWHGRAFPLPLLFARPDLELTLLTASAKSLRLLKKSK